MSEIDPTIPNSQPTTSQTTDEINGVPRFPEEIDILAENEAALAKIEAANPELLEGRVPESLEELVHAAGYTEYAVGFNQSDGVSTIDEAAELLADDGGIELDFYNLDQRFLLHDKEDPMFMYPLGYYGPNMGRFVYVFPIRGETSESPHTTVAMANEAYTDNVPEDMFITSPEGETVVNAKYCAGFIDEDQTFHQYSEFMKDKAEAEDIGDVALANEVFTNVPDTREDYLKDRIEAVKGFLDQEGLDLGVQTEKFENKVRARVDEIWEKALSEGRHQLTDQEIKQIREMNQLIQEHRSFVTNYNANEAESVEATIKDTAIRNAQSQVDRLFELSKDRKLDEQEKHTYRKAKQFLA